MDKLRPTQKDIARVAKVTQATVSLALGDHPRLALETRRRIQAIARKLGYVPDPYLSGLAAHKKKRRPPQFQATLAWVTNWPAGGRRWRDITTFLHYFEGSVERAGELGYRIEEHDLTKPGMSPRRLEQILGAKNIPGILFAPQPHAHVTLDLRLERFSSVAFGYSLASPLLHRVTNHHFRAAQTLFQLLLARGYRRPGLVIESDNELRVGSIHSSAFLHAQQSLPPKDRVPALIDADLTRKRFFAWYRQHRPDVVVSLWDVVYPWLNDAGVRVPEDVGVALLSVRYLDGHFAGMWENPRLVGARAVELLIDLVHRGERGIPEIPSCLMIESTWVEGKTIRPASVSAA